MEQYFLKVNGKPFTCECGCNVFHKNKKTDLIYKCNCCNNQYTEEDEENDNNKQNDSYFAHCICICGYKTYCMEIKDLLFKLSQEGGYIISDKEGGYYGQCPECGGIALELHLD